MFSSYKHIFPLAGICGSLWLGATIIILSIIEYDFMLELGWDPLYAPTRVWPSGLALGPYGIFLTIAFLGSGFLLWLFSRGLKTNPHFAKTPAVRLFSWAGIALAGLSFPMGTDLIGWIHAIAFAILGMSLFPAFFILAGHFRRRPEWNSYSTHTALVALLAIPAFIFKGIAFYGFLLGILLWFMSISVRLMRMK